MLKDFDAFLSAQAAVDNLYRDRQRWAQVCLENIAHSGRFSSDRTIAEYVRDIWKLRL